MTPQVVAARSASRTVLLRTFSAAETRALGEALAEGARAGDRLSLVGPLGAGKTQLAKGFAAGLGVVDMVNSPSFTLMAEYEGRLPFFHQDLYRLGGTQDAVAAGLMDERQDRGVTITEWADRLDPPLAIDRLTIRFTILGDEERSIELIGPDDGRHDAYLVAATRWEARGDLVA